jgi:hypothetical protein
MTRAQFLPLLWRGGSTYRRTVRHDICIALPSTHRGETLTRTDGGLVNYPGGPPRPPGPVDTGGRNALILGVTSLVMVVLFFPAALILGPTAVILGARAQRRAQRRRGSAPGAIGGILCGLVGALLSAAATVVLLLILDEFTDYADCRSGANTQIARDSCDDEFRSRVERRFGARL